MQQHISSRTGISSTAAVLGALFVSLPMITTSVLAGEVTVGAGMRTSINSVDTDNGIDTDDGESIDLDNARLYISGKATDTIGFMFNTQYHDSNNGGDVAVMDAVATFAFSDKVNIWAGRFLPPSDRANLYGPYYSSNWNVYVDGVQDGYPAVSIGRDNGVMYWGQFGKAKVSAGVFDSTQGGAPDDLLGAARFQYDFWDQEGGYYLNGTYYGAKDLLAVGVAAQTKDSGDAFSGDFLLEKKLGGAGVLTVEAEYAVYDELGGYGKFASVKSDGYYVLGAYLFPGKVGIGKFQVLAKYGSATYDGVGVAPDQTQDTAEFNLNYIINDFNARMSLYYLDTSYDPVTGSDASKIGLGLQIQM